MRLTQIVWTMPRISIPLAALLFAALLAFADDAAPADLKVLKLGVGAGTVSSDMANPGIDCGTDCDQSYGNVMVTLTAMAGTNSQFDGWSGGGCSRTGTCTVDMSTSKNVRANFGPDSMIPAIADFTPDGIAGAGGIKKYLVDNPKVNTPARFVAALPDAFKQNWILMTRSESLQTGTAKSPRILLPSADAFYVFTVGMTEHSSYPGSHYNAIEFMQWDPDQKNFRFHEVILDTIPAMGDVVTYPEGTTGPRFKMRTRGISIDDAKCSKCHSTRNVLNINRAVSPPTPGPYPGTDGVSPGTIVVKNKPNWDAYDSWGGAMPFNRDRIYQGSLEAVALKRLFNLWNWRDSEDANRVRQILERLQLQPPHVGATSPHRITRDITSVDDNTHIQFGFDSLAPLATTANTAAYSFNGTKDTTGTPVDQGGRYVTMRHSNPNPVVGTSNDSYGNPVNDEGRGVQLFDLLGGLDGSLNGQRIADELINHRFATGSIPIDVRPIAMAISKGTCLRIDTGTNTVMRANTMLPALTVDLTFFDARNGMNVVDVRTDTKRNWSTALPATRSTDLPRRKADLQKRNFDRTGDPYLFAPENGLIQEYGGTTFDTTISSIRRQMFRRPIESLVGVGDETIMEGRYIDRESYSYNTDRVAMYRYFLEPLGVSVGKWSMSVRGRSRAYNFADVFSTYANAIEPVLRSSMLSRTIPGLTNPDDCGQLINAINTTLSSTVLPPASGAGAVPKYTDIQRIFNKSCIECHGGLGYPPYGTGSLDFSEDEEPPAMTTPMVSPRLARAYDNAVSYVGADLASSFLHTLITRVDELCSPPAIGMMPCGGPPLSKTDIKTIERWILGPPAVSKADGDPHITTVDGTTYDFQSAGEFVLLRDEALEVQTRQTPVSTNGPLGPNDHTGLSSCVSINTAVAVRVGRIELLISPISTANRILKVCNCESMAVYQL